MYNKVLNNSVRMVLKKLLAIGTIQYTDSYTDAQRSHGNAF